MDNADLEQLKVSAGTLRPAFHTNTTEYSVSLASGIASVKLIGTTSDSGASYDLVVSNPRYRDCMLRCVLFALLLEGCSS